MEFLIKRKCSPTELREFGILLEKKFRTSAAWMNVSVLFPLLNVMIPKQPDYNPSRKVKTFPNFFSISNEMFCSLHRWKNVGTVIFLIFGWVKKGI